jgi:hypothetical protein
MAKENCLLSAFSHPFNWLLFAFINSKGASEVNVMVPVLAVSNKLGALA